MPVTTLAVDCSTGVTGERGPGDSWWEGLPPSHWPLAATVGPLRQNTLSGTPATLALWIISRGSLTPITYKQSTFSLSLAIYLQLWSSFLARQTTSSPAIGACHSASSSRTTELENQRTKKHQQRATVKWIYKIKLMAIYASSRNG